MKQTVSLMVDRVEAHMVEWLNLNNQVQILNKAVGISCT